MRKNRMMRLASILLVAVLMTTCTISGTFAKYVTSVESQDSARVAYWGFKAESMDISSLFVATYDAGKVKAQNLKDVIAPGTKGSASFAFIYDETVKANGTDLEMTGPEVAYTFEVAVEENCDAAIKANKNIVWKLDDAGVELTWDELIAKIKNLSGEADGSADYMPGQLPTAFGTADTVHTIWWEWKFGNEPGAYTGTYDVGGNILNQDQYDTYMGNMDEMDDVSLKITITATQVN